MKTKLYNGEVTFTEGKLIFYKGEVKLVKTVKGLFKIVFYQGQTYATFVMDRSTLDGLMIPIKEEFDYLEEYKGRI